MPDALKKSVYVRPAKWDLRFFELATYIAEWSEDLSLKVGAVIVNDANIIISTGFNGLPRGVDASQNNRHDRANNEKDHWYEHAERNAIYNAARIGVPVSGASMYISTFPCSVCMRAIIQSGIAEIITIRPNFDYSKYANSFRAALEMSEDVGLSIRYLF